VYLQREEKWRAITNSTQRLEYALRDGGKSNGFKKGKEPTTTTPNTHNM
jgi:hypothetical protein